MSAEKTLGTWTFKCPPPQKTRPQSGSSQRLSAAHLRYSDLGPLAEVWMHVPEVVIPPFGVESRVTILECPSEYCWSPCNDHSLGIDLHNSFSCRFSVCFWECYSHHLSGSHFHMWHGRHLYSCSGPIALCGVHVGLGHIHYTICKVSRDLLGTVITIRLGAHRGSMWTFRSSNNY